MASFTLAIDYYEMAFPVSVPSTFHRRQANAQHACARTHTHIHTHTLTGNGALQHKPHQGLLLSVKLQACYSFAFVTMQMTSHLLDSRLPLSRAQRIRIRHVAVACLLALTILVSRIMTCHECDRCCCHLLAVQLGAQ